MDNSTLPEVSGTGLESDAIFNALNEPEEVEQEVEQEIEGEKETKEEVPEENKETEEIPEVTPEISSEGVELKALTEKYPDILKSFPQLKGVLETNNQYREVFPTIEDAQEASERSGNFQYLEDKLTSGKVEDLKEFFGAISETSTKAFSSMANNFLPTLAALNSDLYLEATAPVLQGILRSAFNQGVKLNDENLKGSALHLAKFLFDDHEIATGKSSVIRQVDPELEKERDEFNKEKQAAESGKYQEFRTTVIKDYGTKLYSMINNGLDPRGALSDFTKQAVVQKIIETLNTKLNADKQHMSTMNSLWKKAESSRTPELHKRLLALQISKVNQLLPGIRESVIKEAIQTKVKQVGKTEKKEISSSANTGGGSKTNVIPSAKDIDWGKTSMLDALNDKIVTKGK